MAHPTRAFWNQLRASVDGEVRFDNATLALYATDASVYRQVPLSVVLPRHEGDVIRTLGLARENSLPLLARGGGTALAGQSCNAALILDFSKYMNAIRHIDAGSRVATVEPGVVQAQLNAALARHGLFFAPDPATKNRCTIGGMVGNNSCGAHSAAYGKTVDNVEALDVVLYDGTRLHLGAADEGDVARASAGGGREGELRTSMRALVERHAEEIRRRYPKIPRRVSGYNLDELLPERGHNLARAIVGSEGTLAVTLAATLKLVPRPRSLALVVLGFDDVYLAADQVPWILEHRPQALEGFDHRLPDFARSKGLDAARFLPDGRAFLIVELGADGDDEARAAAERLVADARRVRACAGVAPLYDGGAQRAVWGLRESGLGAGALIPGHPRTWPGAEDTAVPPARLGDYLRRFVRLLDGHGLAAATYYGHFGEGCVHCRVNFDFTTPKGVQTFRATMLEIGDLVAEFGGSMSGEHGDGLARSELLPKMFGPRLIEAFADFKRAFDPDFRMNPGVIVNPHPLDSHLRVTPGYRPAPVETHFDFIAEGGLAGAALKCVGIGKCRKTDAGTMCPSYMATREEMHSTRGRAHLLWEALSGGRLLEGRAGDRAIKEALELCLSCKGCKSECPAAVDIAAYKAEFFARYYARNRRPLAVRFFARIHEVARAGAAIPALANALGHAPALGEIVRALLKIHPERELPRFAAQSFRSWFAARGRRDGSAAPEVVLFADTFNNFFEPDVAIAAVEVLERAGFTVVVPPRDLCCGRPLYDAGMFARARWRLEQVMKTLAPYVERGAAVVGLEPSCILTFRDELPSLFPADARAAALAKRAMLLDEFLVREAPSYVPPALARRALVHGHCHQKSLAGMRSEMAILGRVGGLGAQELDAGCCGMAGAFGYGAERFELSRVIGERVLLPAVRASAPDTLVVADGFACRQQIRHLCPGRQPLHLAQLLNLKA
ncbi:MAG TPA: FAD-linked oxidase C-terminal domain-containing protein [Candidatus Binataceae bacterium]|nr:FAD-linked oxidase C-terminal domain-containing protein [Candidatus Binataceae bacterium]